MDFSTIIRTARERAGLSQQQASEKWEIPLGTIRCWEQGQRKPGAKHLGKILEFLLEAGKPTRPECGD
jgi:ribosome-binding protein aMBF1 (putative translation factor)